MAIVLRIWAIAYDLPYIYHPDEPFPIRISYNMLVTHDFNPHFYDWPSLIIYLNLSLQSMFHLAEKIFRIGSPSTLTNPLVELAMGVTYSPRPVIILLSRLMTAAFGVGTVVVTVSAGKEYSRNILVGLSAGLLLAVSPTTVSLSRYITPDTYASFFTIIVLLASILIFRYGKTRDYIIAGLGLGLAISSKYNTALIISAILCGHFLRAGRPGFKDYRLYLTLSLGLISFIIVNPYAILDFSAFYTSFIGIGFHYFSGHAGMDGDPLKWYLSYMWKTGGIIYILAALGLIRGFISRSKEFIILMIFPVLYFTVINIFIVRNDRTFLPLTPFLYILAVSFLLFIIDKSMLLENRSIRISCVSILVVIAVLGSLQLFSNTIKSTTQLTTVNSRETARIWVTDHIQPGSKIALESYAPFIDPDSFSVQGFVMLIDNEPEWYVENHFEYLIFSQGIFRRYFNEPIRYSTEVTKYNALFERFTLIEIFNDGNYEIRIYKVQ
jgi:hypothetical protein